MLRAGLLLGATALALQVLPGCVGNIRDPPAEITDPTVRPEQPAPASRFPRLSHEQWENTTRDLLALPARSGLADTFLPDAHSGTFDNNGDELRVGGVQWANYQQAAETLAEQATATPAALARIVPADAPAEPTARARALVTALGQRAFRRPLEPAEVDRYAALYARGAELFPEVPDATAAGLRLVVGAMLQSPHFLYRVERSTARDGDVIAPTPWELASRLSFALWNTMPDAELFRAAADGTLATVDGVRPQVARMLADPRARDMVRSFHDQLLQTERYADVTRPTARFPEFTPALRASMLEESRAFVQHVVFERGAGLHELLTAPYTFVDAPLARVYGLTGTYDGTMRRVDLDPARRAGLLTMVGFLATNAQGADTDPIHRGVFLNHRILCASLPAPPNNVPPLPAAMGTVTMRQRIEAHTGRGTCGETCHGTMINPVGFAFEHYDALGRWRDTDNGLPVNAADRYAFRGVSRGYDGGPGFARVAADEAMTHECYVRHWVEFVHGRPTARSDDAAIARLGAASLHDDLAVRELLTELITSRAFLTRSTTEAGL